MKGEMIEGAMSEKIWERKDLGTEGRGAVEVEG